MRQLTQTIQTTNYPEGKAYAYPTTVAVIAEIQADNDHLCLSCDGDLFREDGEISEFCENCEEIGY